MAGYLHLGFIGPGGPEILVVMLALLVMFGAKDAPRIFRKLNDILNQIRRTAENFKREVMYSDINSEPMAHGDTGEYDDYGTNDYPEVKESEPGDEQDASAEPAVPDEGEGDDKPV